MTFPDTSLGGQAGGHSGHTHVSGSAGNILIFKFNFTVETLYAIFEQTTWQLRFSVNHYVVLGFLGNIDLFFSAVLIIPIVWTCSGHLDLCNFLDFHSPFF